MNALEQRTVITSALPDFSRQYQHLSHDVTANATITCVGVGGAATLLINLAKCGVRRFNLIDFDTVSPTNIGTQGYLSDQIGQPKPVALRDTLLRIDRQIEIAIYPVRYQELSPNDRERLWNSTTLMLAMTDDHATQMDINVDALIHGVDTLFAMVGDGLRQIEVTATFPEVVARGGGCHACQIWPRVKAYRDGFVNSAVIGSHVVSADLLNAQLAYLALARFHQRAGSTLPIVRLAERFAAAPCLLTQLDPAFWAEDSESYGVVPTGMELFTTRLFTIDTPKGWVCEACGTEGVK